MPLRLEIKKLLASRSERVKSCDLHPDEPWVLSALYSGHLFIWNYNTQTVVKSFEASDQPIRCAKFITRKQWVICGADDMMIRVFNFNTLEKVREFEGHIDYIRYLDVHPTQPYVLSSSDDMQIKLWDWDKGWANTQIFEGHAHYVMQVKFNPKDSNTFASASLDKSVKVWSVGSPLPNFSLEGHERGVNCIDYYLGGDKPYLVSGADDKSVKIWDYQTKACVQTLDGHTSNVSAVSFHPKLPIILSGSEDGTIRMWHATTYRLETTLNYGMERCWALAVTAASNKVAVGYDEGTIVITLGQEMPVVSLDAGGKLLLANNNDISSCSLRGVSAAGAADGEALDVQLKDLGSCEIFPQRLVHNANGRFVAACGDGEYIIYTAQALRNKSFGAGLDFVWSSEGTGDYAVRESSSRVRLFRNFKEATTFKPPFGAEGLFGGNLVAIAGNEFVVFYDWQDCRLVMRIDVAPRHVFWAPDGEHVVLACDESYFVLRCDMAAVQQAFADGSASAEDGVEGAFSLLHEMGERVESGQWVGGCFLYTNAAGRLNYYVGGEVMTLTHLDRKMFLMGFVARENRVFLVDKARAVVSFALLESVLQYQTAVVREDFELANELLATIPRERYNDIARFLESQGHREVALQVADDPDQKLDLALQLGRLDAALQLMESHVAKDAPADDADVQARWKQLGDLALSKGQLPLARRCAEAAGDLNGLLLMHASAGDAAGLAALQETAAAQRRTNVAFVCSLLLGRTAACLDILLEAGRHAEAAFFARTYLPSRAAEAVHAWKAQLRKNNPRAAQALAAPDEYPDLFPEMDAAQEAERAVEQARGGSAMAPAAAFAQVAGSLDAVLVDVLKSEGNDGLQRILAPFRNGDSGAAPAVMHQQHQHQQEQEQAQQKQQQQQQQEALERQQQEEQQQRQQQALQQEQQEEQRQQQEQDAREAEQQRRDDEEAAAAEQEVLRQRHEEEQQRQLEMQAQAARAEAEAQQRAADAEAEERAVAEAEERQREEAEAQQRAEEQQAAAQDADADAVDDDVDAALARELEDDVGGDEEYEEFEDWA